MCEGVAKGSIEPLGSVVPWSCVACQREQHRFKTSWIAAALFVCDRRTLHRPPFPTHAQIQTRTHHSSDWMYDWPCGNEGVVREDQGGEPHRPACTRLAWRKGPAHVLSMPHAHRGSLTLARCHTRITHTGRQFEWWGPQLGKNSWLPMKNSWLPLTVGESLRDTRMGERIDHLGKYVRGGAQIGAQGRQTAPACAAVCKGRGRELSLIEAGQRAMPEITG